MVPIHLIKLVQQAHGTQVNLYDVWMGFLNHLYDGLYILFSSNFFIIFYSTLLYFWMGPIPLEVHFLYVAKRLRQPLILWREREEESVQKLIWPSPDSKSGPPSCRVHPLPLEQGDPLVMFKCLFLPVYLVTNKGALNHVQLNNKSSKYLPFPTV